MDTTPHPRCRNPNLRYFYQPHAHLINFLPPSIHYLIIKEPLSIQLQPDDFKPYTALQLNDLPPINCNLPRHITRSHPDVATNYWHFTDAIGSLQLCTRLDIPNAAYNNFHIKSFYHTYFTGTLDYNEAQQYGKLGQHTLCFGYRNKNPLPLYCSTHTPSPTTPVQLFHLNEPFQTVRLSSGNKPARVEDRRAAFDNPNVTMEIRHDRTPWRQNPSLLIWILRPMPTTS